MPIDNLNPIKKTIEILDSVDYSKYSRARSYERYVLEAHADERKLIQSILFAKFLEQVLGFKLGETVWAEQSEDRNVPDFLPVDTYTHSFL